MGRPIVSVIVITYNQEHELSRTLNSIISQKCPFEFEIIVGEDCSTDGTRKVLEEYASRYNDIIVPLYNDVNRGILKNFISAISKVRGKYIAFCDGDDYWIDPQKLVKQVDVLESNQDVGLVYSDVMVDSKITGDKYYRGMQSPRDDLFTQLLEGNIIVSSTVCMRADLLRFVDFEMFVEQGFLMEDYPMWLSLSLHTKFHYLKEATICYEITRHVVNVKDASLHALSFDKNTTLIRLYFQKKYAEKTAVTSNDILDSHNALGYKCGLNMNDRKFTLSYVSKIANRTPYVRRLNCICKSNLLFAIYQCYRKLSGKTRTPLQMYFGM